MLGQRGLSGAICPDYCIKAAFLYLKTYIPQYKFFLIFEINILCFYQWNENEYTARFLSAFIVSLFSLLSFDSASLYNCGLFICIAFSFLLFNSMDIFIGFLVNDSA